MDSIQINSKTESIKIVAILKHVMVKKKKPILNLLFQINSKISIIGTNHLDKISVQKVFTLIQQLHPQVVMIELDADEYQSFLENHGTTERKSQNLQTPIKNSDLFDNLYRIQQSLGALMHIIPGSELLKAVETAIKEGIKVEFIDLPIQITLERLRTAHIKLQQETSKLTENFHQQTIEETEFQTFLQELQNVDFLDQLLMELKQQYPEIYRVLFTERNEYMINRIWQYYSQHPSEQILIVVGGAHLRDLISLIKKKLAESKPPT